MNTDKLIEEIDAAVKKLKANRIDANPSNWNLDKTGNVILDAENYTSKHLINSLDLKDGYEILVKNEKETERILTWQIMSTEIIARYYRPMKNDINTSQAEYKTIRTRRKDGSVDVALNFQSFSGSWGASEVKDINTFIKEKLIKYTFTTEPNPNTGLSVYCFGQFMGMYSPRLKSISQSSGIDGQLFDINLCAQFLKEQTGVEKVYYYLHNDGTGQTHLKMNTNPKISTGQSLRKEL